MLLGLAPDPYSAHLESWEPETKSLKLTLWCPEKWTEVHVVYTWNAKNIKKWWVAATHLKAILRKSIWSSNETNRFHGTQKNPKAAHDRPSGNASLCSFVFPVIMSNLHHASSFQIGARCRAENRWAQMSDFSTWDRSWAFLTCETNCCKRCYSC